MIVLVSPKEIWFYGVAARLKKQVNKEAEVYRYNADQFAVVIKDTNNEVISK